MSKPPDESVACSQIKVHRARRAVLIATLFGYVSETEVLRRGRWT